MNKKMKRTFVVVFVCALVIAGLFGVRQYLRTLPPSGEPRICTVYARDLCLVSSKTNYFIAVSDLIVRGKCTGETDGPKYVGNGMPFTCEAFHVTEVYKGDCRAGDEIEFAHIGGDASVYKMLRDIEEKGIENSIYLRSELSFLGLPEDIKSWELKEDRIYMLDHNAKQRYALPAQEEECVLFLTKNQIWGCYSVGTAQEYCIREINEKGQLLNPFTNDYETIDWETAVKLTKEDVLPGFVSDYEAHPEKFQN